MLSPLDQEQGKNVLSLENGTVIVEKSLVVSHNAKHGLPFVPATALLHIYPVK